MFSELFFYIVSKSVAVRFAHCVDIFRIVYITISDIFFLHSQQLSPQFYIMPDEGHLFTSYNFKLADACVVCADLISSEGKLCKGLLIYGNSK